MQVPFHYAHVHHGFWQILDVDLPLAVRRVLPSAADCYLESLFFAQSALELQPTAESAQQINWYASAHLAAYISIFDAAKYDVESGGSHIKFSSTPLQQERWARAQTPDLRFKDPLNASQLYRAIRNLRIHFGRTVMILDTRQFVSDQPQWYFRTIESADYRLLKSSPLSDEELAAFNGYLHRDAAIDVFGRMLGIMAAGLCETADVVQSG